MRYPDLFLLLLTAQLLTAGASDDLRRVFLHPPDEAKPRGYWIWPHGNFHYAAIRYELAEFKSKGLGGMDIFDLGVQDRKNVIPPGPGFLSSEQLDGIAFALEEAKRLGLKMGLIASSSWNAGGTWTPSEHASMNLVAWREEVTGPVRFERVLPFPQLPDSFRKPYGTYPLHVPRDTNGLPLFRKEVAVLAAPLEDARRVTDPAQVRVLSDLVDASGKLACDLPAGRWLVMRTVLVNFGQRLWLPSDNSQGLTMDHFSREATRHHFRTVLDRLESRIGPLKATALERLYLASYEANADVTWTPGFEDRFARDNGYRLEPFLPALFGVTVKDQETTERFLYDYRRTLSELFINNLYREAGRLCRERGLLLCSEAGGPGAPLHDVPTEDLKALGAVDVMRGEFWNAKTNQLTPEGFEELQVVKPIASAAHIYGHRIVEMESFTSHINWNEGIDIFRPLADRAFCEGMTRVVYHTMSHNLPDAGLPGWTYQAGTHLSTAQTWWELSAPLHAYLARCSALLMQGDFVADVACYYGHNIPNFAHPKHLRPGLAYGYDYDDLNTEVLMRATVDRHGRLVLPSGMSYAVLTLPDHDRRMDLAVLRHLEKLARAGATIVGRKPERTYGLRGYPEDEVELRALATRLWGNDAKAPVEHKVGRGSIVAGKPARDVLRERGVRPDFDIEPNALRPQFDFIHRRTANQDIYFVRNAATNALSGEAIFRVRGKSPELWDPVQGAMIPVAAFSEEGAVTRLPLRLEAHGSAFVVFTPSSRRRLHITSVDRDRQRLFPHAVANAPAFCARRAADGTLLFRADVPGDYTLRLSHGKPRTVTVLPESPAFELTGPWEVRFPHGWDVPARQEFARLQSWTGSTNAATRLFSGLATYAKPFELPANARSLQTRAVLDLGEVREVARVFLNGHEAGLSAFAPHELEVTDFIRAGTNWLTIDVANTWLNRLMADDALPEAQRKTHTNLHGPAGGTRWRDATPRPSGLLGPVRLRFPREIIVR